jgi:hypothetical protein
MGDVSTPMANPVTALIAQVNRFGPSAPETRRFIQTSFPLAETLDPGVALVAVTIYQRQATDSYSQFHDRGSAAAIASANAGFANPLTFVTDNIAAITMAIALYADSLGLSPASGGPSNLTMTLMIAGAGVALWMLTR